jgi:hypothetical protein
MAKLTNTSETAIAITFLVMNLSTALKRFFVCFCVDWRQQYLFSLWLLSKAIVLFMKENKSLLSCRLE